MFYFSSLCKQYKTGKEGEVIDIHFFCGFYVLIHSSIVYTETRGGVIDIHFFCGFYVLIHSSTVFNAVFPLTHICA